MEQDTLEAIAVISLILVIVVMLYLIAGIIIRNMYPNSNANRFFGGAYTEPPVNEIAERLLNIHNESTGERDRLLDDYLRTLSNNDTSDILRAIVQLASIYVIEYNYISDVLTKCETLGLINPQHHLEGRVHDAIVNSNNGEIVIPEDLRRRIMNPNAILSRNQGLR